MADAVIFDCDGVLINSEVICQRVELQCLADIGLIYEREAYAALYMGTTSPDYYRGLNDDHQRRFGRPLPDGFAEQLSKRVWAEVENGVAAIEGVHHVVRDLKVRKAVASGSSSAGLGKKLRKVGLFDAFSPHIYSAQIVARGKPAPDIFLHAAQQVGADPARCIAVEDSVNGVLSARAADMRVIGFTGGGHCTPGHGERLRAAGAEGVVEHMDQLLAFLGRMS